ncbi:MAG: hypothetical protein RLZZ58_351 [Pseudomonadota bacterium]
MTDADTDHAARQSAPFLFLYALAMSGGAVAYVPFLTIMLPIQAGSIAADGALNLLAYAAFAGAVAASIANIGFGWLSDRSGTRRPWIAAGMLTSSALLIAMPMASGTLMLISMIVAWQLCLNMMLAPLTAWAGDCVPDSQKGLLGGLLAFAPALGALSTTLVMLPGFAAPGDRHLLVALFVIVMVSPVLVIGRPAAIRHLMVDRGWPDDVPDDERHRKEAARRMWLARLLVQIAEASLFAFLLLWFRSVDAGVGANVAANIFTAVLGAAVAMTLVIGRWSDRHGQPTMPLVIAAAAAAVGLLVMSLSSAFASAIAGYVIFGLASSIFLALHASQTLRVLASARRRGRDLGVFNLTNTVPSLIMPWLTLALVPVYGFDALFLMLAALAFAACLLLVTMPPPPARNL